MYDIMNYNCYINCVYSFFKIGYYIVFKINFQYIYLFLDIYFFRYVFNILEKKVKSKKKICYMMRKKYDFFDKCMVF